MIINENMGKNFRLTFETVVQDERVFAPMQDHRDRRRQLKTFLPPLDMDED